MSLVPTRLGFNALVTFTRKIKSSTLADRVEEGILAWIGNEPISPEAGFFSCKTNVKPKKAVDATTMV